jgi:tetratricopeptide (TPR) repeat protein
MPKAFSKSSLAWTFVSLFFYTGEAAQKLPSNNPQQQEELKVWEQSESRKIFGQARRFQLESELIEALKLYSEILEFFPDTDVWPLACIQLSDIYLQRKNIPASEKVLRRLISYRSRHGLTQDKDTLFAQWSFFEKLKRIDDLIIWLDKRNEQEKQFLRDSTTLNNRVMNLARNEDLISHPQLQQLFTALGFTNPLQQVVSLLDHPDFLFSKSRLQHLLNLCLTQVNLEMLRKVVTHMQNAGWAESAHQIFLTHQKHPKADTWKRLWVQLLINSQMWIPLDDLLKNLPQKDWSREILLSSIGQGKWDRAFIEFKTMENWIFSSLSSDDLEKFALGITQDSNQNSLLNEFLSMIPKGSKKDFLIASITTDKTEKVKLLQALKQDSVFDKKAILELAKFHQKERQFDEIKALFEELKQKDPESSELKELKLILDTLHSLQKASTSDKKTSSQAK